MQTSMQGFEEKYKNRILNFCNSNNIPVRWITFEFDSYDSNDIMPLNHTFTVCVGHSNSSTKNITQNISHSLIYQTDPSYFTMDESVDELLSSIKKINKMKNFKNLEFEKIPYPNDGIRSRMFFENGWGISVIRSKFSYGNDEGLYEIAVLNSDGEISYESGLTEDVIGYLTEDQVTEWMEKIQKLSKN